MAMEETRFSGLSPEHPKFTGCCSLVAGGCAQRLPGRAEGEQGELRLLRGKELLEEMLSSGSGIPHETLCSHGARQGVLWLPWKPNLCPWEAPRWPPAPLCGSTAAWIRSRGGSVSSLRGY